MRKRVQVLVSPADLERFRRAARYEGISLSAWLRGAGQERLHRRKEDTLRTPADLRGFFEECERRESDQGPEPEWEQQRRIIDASQARGRSPT